MLTSSAVMPVKKLEGLIRDYIIYLREEKQSSPATVRTYANTIAHFYEMNDVIINWKKLKKFKGKHHGVVDDVPYTRDQIKILIDNCALRDRAMILLMASAGLRRGALPTLRLKDLQKIEKYRLYKITVYKKEQEQYISYCTPECARAIDEYLAWRLRIGEQPTPNTILFRSEFDITCQIKVTRPRPIQPRSITRRMIDLLDYTGVRPTIHGATKYNKTNLMTCHGFRKFFNTQCINHNMNPLYAEYLMGHKTGLIKSYFKPTDNELLEGNDQSLGYAAMIPYLTINVTEEENQKLQEEINKLKQHHSVEWESMREQITEMRQKMGLF
jgi:integrase